MRRAPRPVALVIADARGRRHAMNQTARALFAPRESGASVFNDELVALLCRECAERGGTTARIVDADEQEWDIHGETIPADGTGILFALRFEPVQQAEEVYRRAFQATPNPIIVTRLSDGCVIGANAAVERSSGYSPGELIGQTTADINLWVHPRERDELLRRLATEGRVTDYDVTLRHRTGGHRTISLSAEIVEVGGEPCMITVGHDVTERRQMEQRERDSRLRYQALMDNSPSVIFLKNTDGKYLVVNRTFERVLGIRAEQIIGRDDSAIAPPEVAAAYRRDDQRLLEARTAIPCDDVLVLPSGVRRFFTVKFPLFDEQGGIFAIGGIATDFTERYRAEEELARTNEMLSVIRQSQAAYISGADVTRVWSDLLEAFLRLTRSRAGLLRDCRMSGGRQTLAVLASHGLPTAGPSADAPVLSEWPPPTSPSVRPVAGDAAAAPWVSLPFFRQGRIIGVVDLLAPSDVAPEQLAQSVDPLLQTCAVLLDAHHSEVEREKAVASERALEAQLRESAKMQAIGTLAGGIAHDFNNILTGIFNGIDLARSELPATHAAEPFLAGAMIAAHRAKNLVNQILTFSRRTEQNAQPLPVRTQLRDAAQFLRATLPATIQLEWECEEGELALLADPTQLQQVMLNLGTNAAYAMRRRGGTLRIAARRVTVAGDEVPVAPGDYIRITVADTGEGMDAATLERLFEPFFTTKPAGEGTGLGLAVVHGIVQAHGGAITVESTPGSGTSFHVHLPAVRDSAAPVPAGEVRIPPGRGERVLWVDDERMVTESGCLLLERIGYAVASFNNPEVALTAIAAAPGNVDLVILDLSMPGLTGDQLAARLLKLRADLPLVLMTGYDDGLDESGARALGFRRLVLKPFSLETLANTMRDVLDEARPAGGAE